jgi:hypothetical protein
MAEIGEERRITERDVIQVRKKIDTVLQKALAGYETDFKDSGGYVKWGEVQQAVHEALGDFWSRADPEIWFDAARPTIVCLCGSTRFWREFQRASLRETMAGKIVLSIGAATGTDDEHFGNLPQEEYDRIKVELDELHLRKIDLADEVLILNVDGYIGESTGRELAYARRAGKFVRFLEDHPGIGGTIKGERTDQ